MFLVKSLTGLLRTTKWVHPQIPKSPHPHVRNTAPNHLQNLISWPLSSLKSKAIISDPQLFVKEMKSDLENVSAKSSLTGIHRSRNVIILNAMFRKEFQAKGNLDLLVSSYYSDETSPFIFIYKRKIIIVPQRSSFFIDMTPRKSDGLPHVLNQQ